MKVMRVMLQYWAPPVIFAEKKAKAFELAIDAIIECDSKREDYLY